jgi:hypothetical protein
MALSFADDARQIPSREGMGKLAAIGGIHVPAENVRHLEIGLEACCVHAKFPAGEEFKWSPGPKTWMHKNLVDEERARFFSNVLTLAKTFSVQARVVIRDCNAASASGAPTPELDVTTMFLERVNAGLLEAGKDGLLIIDQPPGGTQDHAKFLLNCIEILRGGTQYADFSRMPLAPLIAKSGHFRLMQLADLVTSCTTAMVAGHEKYAYSLSWQFKS